jgi:hypothetical protein
MGTDRHRRARRSTAPSRTAVVVYALIGGLGLALIGMAIVIGIHVGWVLSETILTTGIRGGNRIWAWVPMLLLTAAGTVLAQFGFRAIWDR